MSDCCFEEDAEQKCEEFAKAALDSDPTNPEAYQTLASLRLSQQRPDEARDQIIKGVALWMPEDKVQKACSPEGYHDWIFKEEQESKAEEATLMEQMELILQPSPSYTMRISLVKLLVEVRFFGLALLVLEGLHMEDDEVIELWFLFATTYFCLGCDLAFERYRSWVDLSSLKNAPRDVQQSDESDEQSLFMEQYLEAVRQGQMQLDEDVEAVWTSAIECSSSGLSVCFNNSFY